jgi:hypothetical protein
MRMHKKTALLLVLAMIVASAGTAFAAGLSQEATPPPPCSGTELSGNVVAVDPDTNTVTVSTSAGLCTVTLNGATDHPIEKLLGMYFGDVDASSFESYLNDAPTVCATLSTGGTEITGEQVTCPETPDENIKEVKVVGYDDQNGTYYAYYVDNTGTKIYITLTIADASEAGKVDEALGALAVDLTLDDNGDLVQTSDLIAQYHDEGTGYGVLVKLFALAKEQQDACAEMDAELAATQETCVPVDVQTLYDEFKSGTGMGQIFKEYSKPKLLGVGHVRQCLNDPSKCKEDTQVQPDDNTNHGQSNKIKPNNIIKNTKAKGPCNVPNNKNKNKCP